MWQAIAGIKNEFKSTIRSSYSFLGSALMKILKKALGHLIFWDSIWIRNDSKMRFFSFRHALSCKIWTKAVTHIIFFPVKVEMLYFWTVLFGAPIWGPRCRYFDMKNHVLGKMYVKNRTFCWSWEPWVPNGAPNRYQESWPTIFSLQKRLWKYFYHHFGF